MHSIAAVFVQTYYNEKDPNEVKAFQKHTNALLQFAQPRVPFVRKDIKIALAEIRQLQNDIRDLQSDKKNKIRTIEALMESNIRLNNTLHELGINLAPSTGPIYQAGLANEYCRISRCYRPTEIGFFGVWVCVLGQFRVRGFVSGHLMPSLRRRVWGFSFA